jgi:hypothetical protein
MGDNFVIELILEPLLLKLDIVPEIFYLFFNGDIFVSR